MSRSSNNAIKNLLQHNNTHTPNNVRPKNVSFNFEKEPSKISQNSTGTPEHSSSAESNLSLTPSIHSIHPIQPKVEPITEKRSFEQSESKIINTDELGYPILKSKYQKPSQKPFIPFSEVFNEQNTVNKLRKEYKENEQRERLLKARADEEERRRLERDTITEINQMEMPLSPEAVENIIAIISQQLEEQREQNMTYPFWQRYDIENGYNNTHYFKLLNEIDTNNIFSNIPNGIRLYIIPNCGSYWIGKDLETKTFYFQFNLINGDEDKHKFRFDIGKHFKHSVIEMTPYIILIIHQVNQKISPIPKSKPYIPPNQFSVFRSSLFNN